MMVFKDSIKIGMITMLVIIDGLYHHSIDCCILYIYVCIYIISACLFNHIQNQIYFIYLTIAVIYCKLYIIDFTAIIIHIK